MPLSLLVLIIIYVGAIPGIIYGGYLEKKGLPQKAIASFSGPDGTRRQVQIDVSWSWTVFAFRGWALAFRGQFMPFLIIMISSLIAFSGFGIFGIVALGTSGAGPWVGEYFSQTEGWQITVQIIFLLFYLAATNYYVAFANRERIKQYMAKGFDFSSSPKVGALYEYVEYIQRTNPKDLAPNVKPGQTHDYVVPDAEVKKQEEEADDYSMLTLNDLKLLLKSEGVPFSTSDTKDELLKLVDKYITKKEKKES